MSTTKQKLKTAVVVASIAAGAAIAGYSTHPDVPDPPPAVAPISVGEGAPLSEKEALSPTASDMDGDGIVDTKDNCPWNAGAEHKLNGCP